MCDFRVSRLLSPAFSSSAFSSWSLAALLSSSKISMNLKEKEQNNAIVFQRRSEAFFSPRFSHAKIWTHIWCHWQRNWGDIAPPQKLGKINILSTLISAYPTMLMSNKEIKQNCIFAHVNKSLSHNAYVPLCPPPQFPRPLFLYLGANVKRNLVMEADITQPSKKFSIMEREQPKPRSPFNFPNFPWKSPQNSGLKWILRWCQIGNIFLTRMSSSRMWRRIKLHCTVHTRTK